MYAMNSFVWTISDYILITFYILYFCGSVFANWLTKWLLWLINIYLSNYLRFVTALFTLSLTLHARNTNPSPGNTSGIYRLSQFTFSRFLKILPFRPKMDKQLSWLDVSFPFCMRGFEPWRDGAGRFSGGNFIHYTITTALIRAEDNKVKIID